MSALVVLKDRSQRDGIIVSLGPIPEGNEEIEVAASLYAGPVAI